MTIKRKDHTNVSGIFKDNTEYCQVWKDNKLYYQKPILLLKFYLANQIDDASAIEDNSLIYYESTLDLGTEHFKVAPAYYGTETDASQYTNNDFLFIEDDKDPDVDLEPKTKIDNAYVNRTLSLSDPAQIDPNSAVFMGNNDKLYSPERIIETIPNLYYTNNVNSIDEEDINEGSIILSTEQQLVDANSIIITNYGVDETLTRVNEGFNLTTWKNSFGCTYYTDMWYPPVGADVYCNTEKTTILGKVKQVIGTNINYRRIPAEIASDSKQLSELTFRINADGIDDGATITPLEETQVPYTYIFGNNNVQKIETTTASIGVRDSKFNISSDVQAGTEKYKANYITNSLDDVPVDNVYIISFSNKLSLENPTGIVVDGSYYASAGGYKEYSIWNQDNKTYYTRKSWPQSGEQVFVNTNFNVCQDNLLYVGDTITTPISYKWTSASFAMSSAVNVDDYNNNDLLFVIDEYIDETDAQQTLDKVDFNKTYIASMKEERLMENNITGYENLIN